MTSSFTYTSTITEFLIRVAAAIQMLYTSWFIVIWITLRKKLALKKYDIDLKDSLVPQAKDGMTIQ
jgi:hypothetical protein